MGKYKSFLLMYNLQKANNIGTLIRSCAAFNVSAIFFVSKKKKRSKLMKEFGMFGNKGTFKKMEIKCFETLE